MPDTSQPSATGHTINSRPSARWAKIQSPVHSDDLFDAGLVSVRAGLEDDGAVDFEAGEGLADGGKRGFLSQEEHLIRLNVSQLPFCVAFHVRTEIASSTAIYLCLLTLITQVNPIININPGNQINHQYNIHDNK
jgi:hypothetical protein